MKSRSSSGLLVQSHAQPGMMVAFSVFIQLLSTCPLTSELDRHTVVEKTQEVLHHHTGKPTSVDQVVNFILQCWSLKAQILRMCRQTPVPTSPVTTNPVTRPRTISDSPPNYNSNNSTESNSNGTKSAHICPLSTKPESNCPPKSSNLTTVILESLFR